MQQIKDFSIYAVSKEGTETVDFSETEDGARARVAELSAQLANGSFQNNTSLEEITGFEYDQLG